MNAKDALRLSIDAGTTVSMGYLSDLTDAELMTRPCPGCNHLNWQLGHLIKAENHHLSVIAPELSKPLPAGFAEKYTNETAGIDDPAAFCTKAELLRVAGEQRAATLSALEKIDDAELEKPSGIEYAPTKAAVFTLQGTHWLMHAGQWAVARRLLGRPPLF